MIYTVKKTITGKLICNLCKFKKVDLSLEKREKLITKTRERRDQITEREVSMSS